MHEKIYCNYWVLKNQIFSLFLIVKMNTNYAAISRVGNLEADFQQVPLVQSSYVLDLSIFPMQKYSVMFKKLQGVCV